MINKLLTHRIMYLYILIIGIILGYALRMYHEHYTGNSHGETPLMSVSEFIATQPDIAIDLTANMPIITDYVNRYNK